METEIGVSNCTFCIVEYSEYHLLRLVLNYNIPNKEFSVEAY